MKKAEGTIGTMLSNLEDYFNERMYRDKDSLLTKYGLEDFDIALYESSEIKVDFEKHWSLLQFSDYSPVFMLRCPNDDPAEGDEFTFYVVFYNRKLNELDSASRQSVIKEVWDKYNINAPEDRDPSWGDWIPVYEGTGYKLRDLGSTDVEGLYALFLTNFEKVYPDFLAKIEQSGRK